MASSIRRTGSSRGEPYDPPTLRPAQPRCDGLLSQSWTTFIGLTGRDLAVFHSESARRPGRRRWPQLFHGSPPAWQTIWRVVARELVWVQPVCWGRIGQAGDWGDS